MVPSFFMMACAFVLHIKKDIWDIVYFSHRKEAGISHAAVCMAFPLTAWKLV